MAIEIIMPKMGMTMTSGTVVRWLCADGEAVAAGQPICEVESDKLNTELTADADGIVSIMAQEGDEIPVGGVLGNLEPAAGAVVREKKEPTDSGGALKIAANGINLNVSRSGEGPAIILIHGLSSSMGLWASLEQDKLAGHTIVSYDLRGHGGSERPSGAHTLAKHVADLAGVMAALNIEQADLVGHSLGAMIAVEMAATHPDRVRSLTLISSAATFPQETKTHFFELASSASFGGTGAVVDKLINWSFSKHFQEANPKVVQTIRHAIKSSDAGSLAAAARMVAKADVTPQLAKIQCPVTIIVGEQDELAPPALSQQLQAGIPGSALHIISDCAHAAPVEQPALVTGYIAERL